jgi:ABC-type sugar transport system ATPase subunit
MMRSPRFLFLDEPTASLEPQSARRVLDLVQVLASQNVGIALVSHRLDEIISICDQFTVLRDAREVAHGSTKDVTEADLVRLMVGDLQAVEDNRGSSTATTRTAIELRGCVTGPGKRAFDLDVPQGRIMALTGLVGSGASDVVQMLGGSKPFTGSLVLDGARRRIKNPRDALKSSIGYAPEDRKGAGLVVDHAIDINVSYSSLKKVSRLGVISWKKVAAIAEDYRNELSIRTTGVHSPVSSLSGGNQQKVMLAKLFNTGVSTLVLEEPTQGVDVRGRAQIHALLRAFADSGGTVLLASTDVREVASVSDQVAVFRHGELVEVLNTSSIREGARGVALQDYLVGVMESGISRAQHDLVHPDSARVAQFELEEAGQ